MRARPMREYNERLMYMKSREENEEKKNIPEFIV
jgi:hypothetical protein